MKISLLTGVLVIMATVSSAQTASDIETEFGKPTKAYSVSEFIWMTPEYAADSQLCRMRLYPKRISGNTNYVVKELAFDDFKSVVDQLIPPDRRGAKREPFDGSFTTGGGSMWATFTYQKVRITYSAGFTFDPEAWKNRKEFTFSADLVFPSEAQAEKPAKPTDDFLLFHDSKIEIVTITWLERKCPEP